MELNSIKNIPENYFDQFKVLYSGSGAIKINERLSEKIKELEEIFNDLSSHHLINGPLGSGKTTATLKTALKMEQRSIFCFPLQLNVKQLLVNIGADEEGIGGVFGSSGAGDYDGVTDNDIKKMLKDDNKKVILCVYDSLPRIMRFLKEKEKVNLIVDEAHNLVTSHNYRDKAIDYIIKTISQKRFRNVIYVTGTPEGLFNLNCVNHLFEFNNPPKPIEINVINYSKNGFYELFHLVKQTYLDGLNVIFIDNFELILRMKRLLISIGFEETEICILGRSEKKETSYIELVRTELIDKKVRFLITTRVMSDGINVNNTNVSNIYSFNSKDVVVKRQFYGRFRKGIKQVFELNLFPESNSISVNDNINQYKEEIERGINEVNNKNKAINLYRDDFKTFKSTRYIGYEFYDREEDRIYFSKERMNYKYFNSINNEFYRIPKLLTEYYRRVCDFQVNESELNHFIDSYYYSESEFKKISIGLPILRDQEKDLFFLKNFEDLLVFGVNKNRSYAPDNLLDFYYRYRDFIKPRLHNEIIEMMY